MNVVFVLSADKEPLMPCTPAIARLLLKEGEVHHLIFRSEQGSDEETNLLTLCKTCHDGLHARTVTLKRTGKKKGNLLHATQMNSIRIQLLSGWKRRKPGALSPKSIAFWQDFPKSMSLMLR